MSELCNRCTAERLSGCGDGRGYPDCQDPRGGFGNGERDNAVLLCGVVNCPNWAVQGCGAAFQNRCDSHAPKETVTAEAERLTQAARHHSYGHPADDFAKVTGMALALWGRGPETPKEHAMYLILVKLSREAHEHKRDNLVDICGYARTIEMIMERESGNVQQP